MIIKCEPTKAILEDMLERVKTEEFDVSKPVSIMNMGRAESGKRIFALVFMLKTYKEEF